MQITILFTDNLISRNRARWSKAEIQRMPNLIVGPGGVRFGGVVSGGVVSGGSVTGGNT